MKKANLVPILGALFFLTLGIQGIQAAEPTSGETKTPRSLASIYDKIILSGAIELDYAYAQDSDVLDNTQNHSTSDLDIGTIELGMEARLHEYVTANLLLMGENLDSDRRIFWDEAFVTLANKNLPFYFIGGKRCQPFGKFESLLINDPITQDLYEINKTGATASLVFSQLGFSGLDLDISATLYKGETLMDRVGDTGYGPERSTSPAYDPTDSVNSFILYAGLGLAENMSLSLFFNSEPGDGERNTTLGSAFHWERAGFILDAEYATALARETHDADNREYKERAWTASLGYQILDPLLIAVRYENFHAGEKQPSSLDHRYSLGTTYTLFENEPFVCNLMGEYRRSFYEPDVGTDQNLNEFFARLALEF